MHRSDVSDVVLVPLLLILSKFYTLLVIILLTYSMFFWLGNNKDTKLRARLHETRSELKPV